MQRKKKKTKQNKQEEIVTKSISNNFQNIVSCQQLMAGVLINSLK